MITKTISSTTKTVYALFLSLMVCQSTIAKMLILTTAYNRPEFIGLQHKTFKKFLKDEYEFKIFNDADNPAMERAIHDACATYNIECIRIPQEVVHGVDPDWVTAPCSFRHGEAIQFALEHSGFAHDGIVFLVDSDTFLIRDFRVQDYLAGNDLLVSYNWTKQEYALVPNYCFLNMPNLPHRHEINFHAQGVNKAFLDAGERTVEYIRNHPDIKIKLRKRTVTLFDEVVGLSFQSSKLKEAGYTDNEMALIKALLNICYSNPTFQVAWDSEIGFIDGYFLDYMHGSGWHHPDGSTAAQKWNIVSKFFEVLLEA